MIMLNLDATFFLIFLKCLLWINFRTAGMYDIDLIYKKKSVPEGGGGVESSIQAPVVKFGNKYMIHVLYNVLYFFLKI